MKRPSLKNHYITLLCTLIFVSANLSAAESLRLERLTRDRSNADLDYYFAGEVMNGRYALIETSSSRVGAIGGFGLMDGTPNDNVSIDIPLKKELVADLGDYLLISGYGYSNGKAYDLWVSDGTEAGTIALVRAVETYRYIDGLVDLEGMLIFSTQDMEYGPYDLWASDGTQEGTTVIANEVKSYFYLGGNGEYILFLLPTEEGGTALWKSGGTEETTELVMDLSNGNPGRNDNGDGYKHTVTEVNGHYIFPIPNGEEGAELWTTDGTAEGTEKIEAINALSDEWSIQSYGKTSKYALVIHKDFKFQSNVIVWSTDGTAEGTREVLRGRLPYSPAYEIGGVLLFNTRKYVTFFDFITALVRTDGTPEGTYELLSNGRASFLARDSYYVLEDRIIFVYRMDLWVTDGTPKGTQLLKDLDPDNDQSYPGTFEAVDGHALFGISNGEQGSTWVTDGTLSGTRTLGNVSIPRINSDVNEPVLLNGRYLLWLDDGIHGRELWATDLTEEGTALLADTIPGEDSNEGLFYIAGSRFAYFTSLNWNRGSAGGFALWRTDGTPAGTRRIKQIVEEGVYSDHNIHGVIGNTLVFSFSSDNVDRQLWVSDGTARGTRPMTAIQRKEPFWGSRGRLGISKLGEMPTGQFIRVSGSESQDGIYFLSATDGESASSDALLQGAYVNETTRFSDWYGWYFISTQDNSWVYHLKLGFIYASGNDSRNIWSYSDIDGWQWTSASVYPWQYFDGENSWAYFYLDSVGSVWVYHASTDTWEYRPSENENF